MNLVGGAVDIRREETDSPRGVLQVISLKIGISPPHHERLSGGGSSVTVGFETGGTGDTHGLRSGFNLLASLVLGIVVLFPILVDVRPQLVVNRGALAAVSVTGTTRIRGLLILLGEFLQLLFDLPGIGLGLAAFHDKGARESEGGNDKFHHLDKRVVSSTGFDHRKENSK